MRVLSQDGMFFANLDTCLGVSVGYSENQKKWFVSANWPYRTRVELGEYSIEDKATEVLFNMFTCKSDMFMMPKDKDVMV